jgi:hypothetical protein
MAGTHLGGMTAPSHWVTSAVIGIVLATFLSDVGQGMITAT